MIGERVPRVHFMSLDMLYGAGADGTHAKKRRINELGHLQSLGGPSTPVKDIHGVKRIGMDNGRDGKSVMDGVAKQRDERSEDGQKLMV